jgi:hypothetical protein
VAKKRGHKQKPKVKNPKLVGQRKPKSKKVKTHDINLGGDDLENAVDEFPTPRDRQAQESVRSRGDAGKLLTDPHRVRSDLAMIKRALNKGWNVRRKTMIRRRLESIVMKTLGEVVTKDGVISTESKADELAIKASSVLLQMDHQDVERVKFLEPDSSMQESQQQPVVNVNVSINSRTIELARLADKFGARELCIDGASIPIEAILGAADSIPED